MTTVSEEEYLAACNDLIGFCTTCCEFTREDTENDAENYKCPNCSNTSVFGAEQALLLELIDIE